MVDDMGHEEYVRFDEFDKGEFVEVSRRRLPPVRYQVVTQPSVDALVREVQCLQRAGWRPIGGVTFVVEANDLLPYTYLQAMVREPAPGMRLDAVTEAVERLVKEAIHGQE